MSLRRILHHFRTQNWTAVCIDLVVVVVGVFVGIQVANWNESRLETERKNEIVEALIADISDSISVRQRFIEQIDLGLSNWKRSHARGEKLAPYYFRINGSDTAPNLWAALQDTQLVDLFDPETLFDLAFYYSEVAGVGQKYVRYVTFVEESILPYAAAQTGIFYEDGKSSLKPIYRANMDRLQDYRDEAQRLHDWARCLVFRLQSHRTFSTTCLRANFILNGMVEPKENPAQ